MSALGEGGQDAALSHEVNAEAHHAQSQPYARKIYMFAWFDLFVRRRETWIYCMAFGVENTLAGIRRPPLKEH